MLPAAMVAPRSPTTWPTNAIRVSMSIGGAVSSVASSVRVAWSVVISGLPRSGIRGGCCSGVTLLGAVAVRLQRRCNLQRLARPDDNGWSAEGAVMRAREPDLTGYVDRDGVKVAYEVFGGGSTTI